MSSGSSKNNVNYTLFVYKSYIWYMCKQDLVLNNPQGLTCHKKQTDPIYHYSELLSLILLQEFTGWIISNYLSICK